VRHWPAARAVLVTLVILAGLVDGCPLPPAKKVAEPLRPAYDLAKRTRQTLLRPLRPARDLLRMQQRWKLFPTAREEQHRMWIEARSTRGGPWELIYRPHEPEHDFRADAIEYRRLRGAWNPGGSGPRRGYGPFSKWVAAEIFAERPDVREVRIRMEKIRIDPDDEGAIPLGQFEYVKMRRRPVVREPVAREPVVREPVASDPESPDDGDDS
jgi:hypothetical protein